MSQWERERPDLDVSTMPVIGRLHRVADALREELLAVYRRYGLGEGEVDILAAVRRTGGDSAGASSKDCGREVFARDWLRRTQPAANDSHTGAEFDGVDVGHTVALLEARGRAQWVGEDGDATEGSDGAQPSSEPRSSWYPTFRDSRITRRTVHGAEGETLRFAQALNSGWDSPRR